jgi:LytS/YehU family sensor histidine kinase
MEVTMNAVAAKPTNQKVITPSSVNQKDFKRVVHHYEGKFEYSIDVDKTLDIGELLIPPMLMQPFIENSIEHGIKHKEEPGNISIRVRLKDDMIIMEMEDDGVGRAKVKEIQDKQNSKHKSLATILTQDRIQVINKRLNKKISFSIVDLKDEKGNPSGTLVSLEIPATI